MAVLIIPVCGVCGKQGAVEVEQNISLQQFLGNSGNRRNGFKYGALIGGDWLVYCDSCGDKSDKLKDAQEAERKEFYIDK